MDLMRFAQEVSEIPQDVLDRLPPDIVDKLRSGVLDKIPEDVVDRLPPSVQDRIPSGFLESAAANPVLAAILIGIGVLAVVGFVYAIVKSAFKTALYAGIAAAAVWFWYFNL